MQDSTNWRRTDDYPDATKGSVTLGAWVWEFVRRNPSYRDDFERLARPAWDDWYDFLQNPTGMSAKRAQTGGWYKSDFLPGALSSVWTKWRIALTGFGIPSIAPPEIPSQIKKPSMLYVSPATFVGIEPEYVVATELHTDIEIEADETLAEAELERIAWVKVDFRKPIIPQMRRLEDWARIRQDQLAKNGMKRPHQSKPRFDRFQLYLRVLDAKEAGAAQKEMAAILFPKIPNRYPENRGAKYVENTYRAAKKIRDSGWRDLLIW